MIDPFAFGTLLLIAAGLLCVIGLVAGVVGWKRNHAALADMAVRAGIGVFPLVVGAVGILIWGFLTDHFEVKYIAYNSERTMPTMYKISALWGSLEGSVLLWLLMLSGFSAAALLFHRRRDKDIVHLVSATLCITMGFFIGLLLATTNPFTLLDFVPVNGLGLNPLLQNIGMAFHPPTMYIGFTSLTVPFAFAVAALISGQLDSRWVRTTRAWTLIGWIGLTMGNLLGANWAYVELGWGGYWGWDPVENAALMPWFTVTAFLHSIMIQEKRGMLKIWNIILILMSYWLTIFGTFLTRSGVVSSVHAFSDSNLGSIFLAYLGTIMLGSALALVWRWDDLRPDNQLDSPVSREAAFVLNNILLVTIAMIVLWGTTWPIFVEAFTGKRASVGAPLFNQMNAVPSLLLLATMGIGPMISWRRMKLSVLARAMRGPAVILATVAILEAVFGTTHYFGIGAISLSAFALAGILLEYGRGVLARGRKGENPVAALHAMTIRNPRRYTGYIVHTGVCMVFVALAGNLFASQKNIVVHTGETVEFEGHSLTLTEIREIRRQNFRSTMSVFDVSGPAGTTQMWPEKRKYLGAKAEESTEVAIWSTALADLYVVVLDRLDTNRVSIRLHRNPLVQWIWIGGVVMAIGALLGIIYGRLAVIRSRKLREA